MFVCFDRTNVSKFLDLLCVCFDGTVVSSWIFDVCVLEQDNHELVDLLCLCLWMGRWLVL